MINLSTIARSSWGLLVVFPLFVFIYWEPIAATVGGWFTRSLSYGWLILAISFYLIWDKRTTLQHVGAKGAPATGSALMVLSGIMLSAGAFSGTILLQQISLVLVILAILLTFLGFTFIRYLIIPVGYLGFSFPLVSTILEKFSSFFQTASAAVASLILSLTAWPYLREGHIIVLPHITLDVVKECAGLHHIITLVALSVPLAFHTQRTGTRKAFIALASVFVGLFSNGVRIALIGVWTYFNKETDIHGPVMTLGVTLFVVWFGLFIMILLALAVRRIPTKHREEAHQACEPVSAVCPAKESSVPLLACVLVLLATGLYVRTMEPKPFYPKHDLSTIPLVFGGWHGRDVTHLDESFETSPTDLLLKRIYSDGNGNRLKLYVGYFAKQNREKKIFNSQYAYIESRKKAIVHPGGDSMRDFAIAQTYIEDHMPTKAKAYYFYAVNGRLFTDKYRLKAAVISDSLIYNRNSAAIVILVVDGGLNSSQAEAPYLVIIDSLGREIMKRL